ncbi:hypothetical protein G7068_02755 [Leucobacter viscericola]|uniref:Protein ImuA n=1 Tax=Leucobacter viscericola TaxID=2714935 RepID=A0A6G7XCA6_9MICO|nr:hypothetical protein [Leucobacter viscericola]QIK62240.1 hypothetical protein G7068_02755 [Leucobacter viscericola]
MHSSSTVRTLQQRITQMQPLRLDDSTLPTAPGLRSLFPGGALRKGASYSVQGSAQLALSMLAASSASGAWCGIIGYPTLGAETAAALGIALERCILIPEPGADAFGLCGALSEILTVLLLAPTNSPRHGDVARIAARLREHGAALVVTHEWPNSESTFRVTASRWSGLGDGFGALEDREITVQAQDRRGLTSHTVRFAHGSLVDPGLAKLHRLVPQ